LGSPALSGVPPCLGLQVLTDIEMLAHTDYFVGSYNSGMVGLIEILRFALYDKSRFTFVDASENHRDWFQSIRNYIQTKNAAKASRKMAHLR
jgi:hypothetical protein